MKAYSDAELLDREVRQWWLGFAVGCLVLAFAAFFAVYLLQPNPPAVSKDPRMDKLCHWPAKPGEGMVALVLEDGTKRCFELGR